MHQRLESQFSNDVGSSNIGRFVKKILSGAMAE